MTATFVETAGGEARTVFLIGLDQNDLLRFALGGPLEGEIRLGQVYGWEPLLRKAAELTVVTRAEDGYVWSRRIDDDRVVRNDESRFREACVRTMLRDHPVKRSLLCPPLPLTLPA